MHNPFENPEYERRHLSGRSFVIAPPTHGMLARVSSAPVTLANGQSCEFEEQTLSVVTAAIEDAPNMLTGTALIPEQFGTVSENDLILVVPLPIRDEYLGIIFAGGGGLKIGVLDGAMAYGGSAVVSIWTYSGLGDIDTGENITAYDWLLLTGQTISAGKKVVIAFVGYRWRVIAAQCESP